MARVSVLTPTYNRCDKLTQLYNSLEASTYKDFEWFIVDDGSPDDTEDTVRRIQAVSSFPVHYYKQENSGKYVALNKLYSLANSEYCFQIDDDDELLPDAMEKGLYLWDSMDASEREKTWCVCGRCIDEEAGNMVGNPYPENINTLSLKEQRRALKRCIGEKCGFQKVSVVSQYKFPVIEGCHFIFESFLWDQINSNYRQYYTNEKFRIYHIPKRGGKYFQ